MFRLTYWCCWVTCISGVVVGVILCFMCLIVEWFGLVIDWGGCSIEQWVSVRAWGRHIAVWVISFVRNTTWFFTNNFWWQIIWTWRFMSWFKLFVTVWTGSRQPFVWVVLITTSVIVFIVTVISSATILVSINYSVATILVSINYSVATI